jgi:hypothetical protein
MATGWGRSFLGAIGISLWLVALIGVLGAWAQMHSRWRDIVVHYRMDLDPTPRADDATIDRPDQYAAERATQAARVIRDSNHEYAVQASVCALITAGLVAIPIVRRRRVRLEPRPSWRASWRAWALVPVVLGLIALGIYAWLSVALRGFIKG